MGLSKKEKAKRFFKKVGKGIANGVKKVWKFGKNVVKGAVNIVNKIPGAAPVLNAVTKGGWGIATAIADQIPEGDVKKRAINMISKGEAATEKAIDKGIEYANKGGQYIKAADNMMTAGENAARNLYRKPMRTLIP